MSEEEGMTQLQGLLLSRCVIYTCCLLCVAYLCVMHA
jgi:hypothetical protein